MCVIFAKVRDIFMKEVESTKQIRSIEDLEEIKKQNPVLRYSKIIAFSLLETLV